MNWRQRQWADPLEAGSLFHHVVARFDRDRNKTLATEELMARQDLPLALREKVRDWALEVVQRDDLKECWDGSCTVLRELPLLMGNGQFLRPDMVLLRHDGTARVIEFKTGSAKDEHLQQVDRYVTALRESGIHAEGEVVYVGREAA